MGRLGFFLSVIMVSAIVTSLIVNIHLLRVVNQLNAEIFFLNLSLGDPLVKNKLEPWLWDKPKSLEANGRTRFYSISISMLGLGAQEYEERKRVADFLKERHNATILYIGTVLNFTNLRVRVPEIKRIASYDFVELAGDGEAKVTLD